MVDYSIRKARMKYADVDRIYQTIPLDNIPWNSETPPDALVRIVQDGKVRPCKTIDLGVCHRCGRPVSPGLVASAVRPS